MSRRWLAVLLFGGMVLGGVDRTEAGWYPASHMHERRAYHTATLLPSGKVLVIGGGDSSDGMGAKASSEVFDPASGTWTSSGVLPEPKLGHTATLLPSGLVLIAGGNVAENLSSNSAQLYDPVTGTFTPTGSLTQARSHHTATLLSDGKVFVTGGAAGAPEVYDPVLGQWSAVHLSPDLEPFELDGDDLTATLLPARAADPSPVDRILVTESNLAGIEIYTYSPGTGSWDLSPQLLNGLDGEGVAAAITLSSGKVLLVGNTGSEIWDPLDASEQTVGSHDYLFLVQSVTLLPSGKVMVVVGGDGTLNAEIFDPSTLQWSTIPTPLDTVNFDTFVSEATVLLPDGSLLVTGGTVLLFSNPIEVTVGTHDATTFVEEPIGTPSCLGTFDCLALPDSLTFTYPRLLPLQSGRVLAVGDSGTAAVFDEDSMTWTAATPPPLGANPWQEVVLPSGKVLATDRYSAWIYSEPPTDSWTEIDSPLPLGSYALNFELIPLKTGKVLLVDGSFVQLFDPDAGTWRETGSLSIPEPNGSAVLLPSGKVLVTGGDLSGTSQIYDPETEQWTTTGLLHEPRISPQAVLLPSGQVFLIGGVNDSPSVVMVPEVYDPATGVWTELVPPSDRFLPTGNVVKATLLPSGDVLVNVGLLASGDVFEPDSDRYDSISTYLYSPSNGAWEVVSQAGRVENTLLRSGKLLVVGTTNFWLFDPVSGARPSSASIQSVTTSSKTSQPFTVPPVLTYGTPLVLEGTSFRGLSEGSDGRTNKAAVNFPLVRLRSLDGRTSQFLTPSRPNFSDTEVSLSAADFPPGSLDPGRHLLSVVVAGVASDPVPIDVECGAKYTASPEQTALPVLGATGLQGEATFVAHCVGAEHYQWRKDGFDISGATGATYTSLPVTAADLGSSYSVVCRSSCDDVQSATPSASTPLAVVDNAAPTAAVLSPNGGEVWVLTPANAPQPNTQTLTWSMSDDGLICKLAVKLLALTANGDVAQTLTLDAEDKGAGCSFSNQVTTTSFQYTVPNTLPAPQGLLYKIEVDVTDEAGHTTVAESKDPFYLVNPATSDAVRTLILSNLPQMQLPSDAAAALTASLSDLARFANAPGVWFDLSQVSSLAQPLADWGSCQQSAPPTCDAATANALVSAIRHYIASEILPAYPKLQYVVLVGDDRAIPFARVADVTTGPAEKDYVPSANLTAGSTVGSALQGNSYLSDDVVASHSGEPFPADGANLVPGAFLPDLAVGRLVETPGEIIQTITNFIQQNGVLDLTQTPHKVLVTGYDFLLDSAQAIARDWTASLPGGAVDGDLLQPGWTAADLKAKLANDHRISFLNGHAAHFEEGVPGTSATDIQGLSAADIASLPAPGLNGGVVFAVGCHGGLTVPGSDASDSDHSLDLPQTFLRQGAIAYVASSGFGWGLADGIGYSERLIQLLSDGMRAGGTIVVGDAVRDAKLSYFLERLAENSAYDQKVLFQWTLFGLPMYAVKTGISAKSAAARSLPPRKEVPTVEHLGPVTVTKRLSAHAANAAPPPFLTQLDLAFDFSGENVYQKHDAAGNPLDATDPGCPPDANGCYYTLNGLSTGAAGLPILPYFVYDSRLSGTSQHGALWLGGSYVEEKGWTPVLARLISNNGAQTSGGSLPYVLQAQPMGQSRPRPTGTTSCPPSDVDLDSLVVVTGEAVNTGTADTRHRRFDDVDIEILYYNNNDSRENCKHTGPTIAAPVQPYHRVNGSTVTWTVPVTVTDGDAVWRVLVLYDFGPDSQGRGAWTPLELAPDGSGSWTGSLTLSGKGLNYLIEAVSTHGNVGWLASGIEGVSIPTPTAVDAPPTPSISSPLPSDTFGVGDTVVLAGSAVDAQGATLLGSALSWTVLLHQGSQVQTVFGPASGASVSFTAPPPSSLAAAVDGYLEIELTATDSAGLSNTVHQRLDPAKVALAFATQPAGLTLTIDGAALATPQNFTSWRGYPIDLAAHPQTGAGGESYVFQAWSDGGAPAHTLVTPAAPATDTALFLLSQTTGPLAFFTVRPCRMIDTRRPLGPMGGPSLSTGQVRSFTLRGVCKVPPGARAVAVNVTAVNPTSAGHLTIHPADQAATATSVLNFTPGRTRANNAILDLGGTGTIAVTYVAAPGTVDFVVDLVGFFE